MITAVLLLGASVANLTGTWKLNQKASDWGKAKAPKSVIVTIEHQEPSISVHGTVVEDNERSNEFQFDAKVDGSQSTSEDGSRVLRRVDDRTIESDWKSTDGRFVEKSKMSLSRDGRRLTREVDMTSPDGRSKRTEVYDKQ